MAAAVLFGGAIRPTVLAKSTLTPASAAPLAAASPTLQSSEDSAHETAETPTQEAAESMGTARPGGGAGHAPNETAAHETGETAAQEADEDARKAAPAPAA